MKLTLIIIAAILSSAPTAAFGAQGQARKNVNTTGRGTKPGVQTRATTVLTKSGKIVATPSGLTYVVTRQTKGLLPRPGQRVIVNYTGILTNGLKFDSSLDRGQPFVFELGRGQVIKGWDEGIGRLHVGEQATLIIPPELGYGASRPGHPIPPNATLIFVVELIGIEGEPAAK